MLERKREKFCVPRKFWQTFQAVPHFRYTAGKCNKDSLTIDMRMFSGYLSLGIAITFEPRYAC